MKRTLLALALVAAPGFAAAQINFAPGPLHNTVTCAAFTGMGIVRVFRMGKTLIMPAIRTSRMEKA